MKTQLVAAIKSKAMVLGFCKVGILPVSRLASFAEQHGKYLKRWLAQHHHAEMQWMVTHLDKRLDPASLMEDTRTIVCVAMNYFNPDAYDSDTEESPKECGQERITDENPTPHASVRNKTLKIAKYARGTDYHYVVKDRLKDLLAYLQTIDPTIQGRALTDSAPILEKPLAIAAGLGWMGKNGNLLTPDYGSFLFLGELLLNIDLSDAFDDGSTPASAEDTALTFLEAEELLDPGAADAFIMTSDGSNDNQPVGSLNMPQGTPMPGCGTCTRCIDACPTGAIIHQEAKGGSDAYYGVVDANRCLSYWTIEYKGEAFPEEISRHLNGWIFGCDICQDVCPWNIKFARPTQEPAFLPREWNRQPQAADLLNLTPDVFRERYRKSPIQRTKHHGLQRNVREAIRYF